MSDLSAVSLFFRRVSLSPLETTKHSVRVDGDAEGADSTLPCALEYSQRFRCWTTNPAARGDRNFLCHCARVTARLLGVNLFDKRGLMASREICKRLRYSLL